MRPSRHGSPRPRRSSGRALSPTHPGGPVSAWSDLREPGKSTYAAWLAGAVAASGRPVALVPMDGFHLAHGALGELGLVGVKGAPQTFDAHGYRSLLQRLRDPAGEVVWAPRFDRDLEEPIAGAIPVGPAVSLVVTEGNYLLLESGAWAGVRAQLDACWYVDLPDEQRRVWLRARHERYGRTPDQAAERTLGSDEANARLVHATRHRADAWLGPAPFSPPSSPPLGSPR